MFFLYPLKKQSNCTYARAVQLLCCWRVDQRILFMALGIIHAIAIQAPNILNSKSVTVAIATPTDTTTRARTCIPSTNFPISFFKRFNKKLYEYHTGHTLQDSFILPKL